MAVSGIFFISIGASFRVKLVPVAWHCHQSLVSPSLYCAIVSALPWPTPRHPLHPARASCFLPVEATAKSKANQNKHKHTPTIKVVVSVLYLTSLNCPKKKEKKLLFFLEEISLQLLPQQTSHNEFWPLVWHDYTWSSHSTEGKCHTDRLKSQDPLLEMAGRSDPSMAENEVVTKRNLGGDSEC